MGTALPALAIADHYTIDPEHTYPSLEFSHMGLSIWRGKFDKTTGKIVLDRAAKTGSVEIHIDTASIDFGHQKMKEHAISADWLNVAKFPTMVYQGAIKFNGDVPSAVDGQLTLRGVTKPVNLKINSFKCMPHPLFKKEVCGADAEGDLNRADFGMTLYSEGEAGKIHLRIQVEALKDDAHL
ncbi:MAG: polyisoprenoid-binding protein [Gammaproteobacteria bacterium]|nr:polyisoprenoid-binding protein [Gammaproteobacteria bacterium]